MDLPNIKTVVQWKAMCDLCTLWQRFGRVARGQDAVGSAILLVERKNTDEERLAKAERAAKRNKKGASTKRKAIGIGNCEKAKRPALLDRSLNHRLEEVPGDGDTSLEDNTNVPADREPELNPRQVAELVVLAFKEERRAHYSKREKTEKSSSKGKSRADLEVGSPMDDFINMHASINCRRIVPEVYFGNDRTRELQLPLCIHAVVSRFNQHSTIISSATQLLHLAVLVVHKKTALSAVISVILDFLSSTVFH